MSRDDIEDAYELTPLQQGILVHALRQPGDRIYVVHVDVELDDLDRAALASAWTAVVASTPPLRTSVHWEALDKPLQLVHRRVELPLRLVDDVHAFDSEDLRLDRAPLFRIGVAPSGRGHVLRWTYHHIILDGWSAGLVLQDVLAAYRLARGEPHVATRVRRPFVHYVAWLQTQAVEASQAFWRSRLATSAVSTALPASRDRTTAPACRSTSNVRIGAEIVARLRAAANAARVTVATIVHAAWALLLNRYSGSRKVVFGTVVSGRGAPLEGIDDMVGMFINTLPVAVDVDAGPTVRDWLVDLQASLVSLREHEHSSLLEIRSAVGISPGQPLFLSVLVFERFVAQALAATGMRVATRGAAGTDVPLSLCLAETADGIVGSLTFERGRFDESVIAAIPAHLEVVLGAIPQALDRPVWDLPVLTEAESRRLLVDFNEGVVVETTPTTIHGLFYATARSARDRVAIIHDGGIATYGDLADASRRLAARLRASGLGAEMRVGLCCRRTPEMIAAMYGILTAGAAYVPLDPAYPAERLAFISKDAQLAHVVTDGSGDSVLPRDLQYFDVEPVTRSAEAPLDGDDGPARPMNLAYVLYTSGSTGRPKGVAIEHRSATILLRWARATYVNNELDGVLASTSINFDCSIFEIFAPLACGGRVVLATSPVQIPSVPPPHEIRLASLVPANLLAQLRSGALPASLRGVNLGGEASPRELLDLLASYDRGLEIFHVYGPTEDTTYTTCARLRVTQGDVMPIGRPLPETAIYLLDSEGRLVPPGCIGELYIAGSGLARGYLDRPDLTADRFVPDHVSQMPGRRLYRTGDLGRHRADGEVELVGRIDQQVKLRGYRIELAEIEAALSQHPTVADVACVLRTSEDGDRFLAAYVTARPGHVIDIVELRRWLSTRLPAPMVPAQITPLEAMPRNPNGKIDRQLLPSPGRVTVQVHDGEPPRDRLELELARIWEEILGVSNVSREDRFGELGGHSLHAVSVISRVQRVMGVRVPLSAMVDTATPASMADAVRQYRSTPPTPLVTLSSRGDGAPMFLVHPALGGVLCYSELSRALGQVAPLHALQAPGLDGDETPRSSVEELAAIYSVEIARCVPDGEVVIGGWSFGAVVAHEIARRVVNEGRFAKLVLLDPPRPVGGAYVASARGIEAAFAEQLPGAQLEDPAVRRVFDVFAANMTALASYRPARVEIAALLITAAERWQDSSAEVAKAWSGLVSGLEAREVPGNHISMLRQPHVAAVARVFQNAAVPIRTSTRR